MGTVFWESPFVLDPPPAAVERHGDVDLHVPAGDGRHPAVVVVHGVPGPPEAPDARDWPLYRGYGALLAEAGVLAAVPRLTVASPDDLYTVAARVAAAAELLRADPRVDADRLGLWFFSGAGLLLGDWLRDPPAWLRGVAATYPLLAPLPGWPPVDPRFRPLDALDLPTGGEAPQTAGPGVEAPQTAGAARPTLVLTRAGRERPEVAPTVEAFTVVARRRGIPLRVVDVPNGQHGFDALDHTEESRAAVRTARDTLLALLTAP
ncbi:MULTISPECIES: hypothetical protein [unclassified Micromonospora]|uniref:hypothetical protein n=1 Tax=unclassified Micromonospora TaxID=2617518 RepID=UPI001C232957|nr:MULTISPECIES: hypothetical protein [unclassified Micromonospora]MBU8855975.1 hypothetical protein [Micromonospora sp. WMMB482]MDM4781581.1 hypothetical protein [Micromonospora sp. b486]